MLGCDWVAWECLKHADHRIIVFWFAILEVVSDESFQVKSTSIYLEGPCLGFLARLWIVSKIIPVTWNNDGLSTNSHLAATEPQAENRHLNALSCALPNVSVLKITVLMPRSRVTITGSMGTKQRNCKGSKYWYLCVWREEAGIRSRNYLGYGHVTLRRLR